LVHAQFSYDYLSSLNVLPNLNSIPEPKQGKDYFKDLANIIKLSLAHEEEITNQCNKFAKICIDFSDNITFTLAQKYCTEQVEELNKMYYWISRISKFGNSEVAMRMLDEEMGK